MKVIPVVDLMGGKVVRARMGERGSYRPIETPLSLTSDPVDVVQGLLRLAPFPLIYVADLDAIQRRGSNVDSLLRLQDAFPDIEFWIDNGSSHVADIDLIRTFGAVVLGSESQLDTALLASHRETVLSLDFKGDEFIGPSEILKSPSLWPNRVIVMSLMRIGAGAGPDIERLRLIRALAGSRQIFAAGGVRGGDDLASLRELGADGALVASALHDGRLRPNDLELMF